MPSAAQVSSASLVPADAGADIGDLFGSEVPELLNAPLGLQKAVSGGRKP